MTRGVAMSAKFLLTLGVGLFLAAGSAWAFQEERPAAPAEQAPATAGVAEGEGGEAKGQAAGTDVTIPGLGKLGTLPKMDFGLELLYGANDGKPAQVEPDANPSATPDPEDLTIRGTMKHNF